MGGYIHPILWWVPGVGGSRKDGVVAARGGSEDVGEEVVVVDGIPLRRNRDGTWSEPPYPSMCVNGHELGPHRVTIGVSHCRCGILHRTAQCNECGATYYLPVPGPDCSATELDGRPG
ncbi:hypothetical protein EB74_12690 [Mycobacterium sp. SWH-M5]|nr:hypothetical protein EB74_12690 [Mycobacterium sp. SWH-M5]